MNKFKTDNLHVYIFRFWAYLMMVIPETRRAHFTW